ncbi:hypothetical protein [Kitasatospora sp. MBT66]|uniref:hypothetical protein n=1 Tax=Kitasatospora sp. MBT66 TaxID=1444769 RepID=UPI000AA5FBA1|nr:hypothetical protein [Kitasatospora sp. MBT66]
MTKVIEGDPVRHRTDGWTGTVAETPSGLANHAWVNRDSSGDTYPEMVLLTDLESAE